MKRIVPAVAFLFLISVPVRAADSWQTYANARYGYSLCYPANLFIPQPEADNGDGRHLTTRDGTADIAVYAGYNALEQSLKEVEKEHADDWEANGQVTYRAVRADWFVISGTSHDKIFYDKTVAVDKDASGKAGEFDSFRIVYPAAKARIYKPIVDKLSKCFAHAGHVK